MPATCQNLPTLNSLPHLEFNKVVPKSHNCKEEAPQNSGLLIPQSVLFQKTSFMVFYLPQYSDNSYKVVGAEGGSFS